MPYCAQLDLLYFFLFGGPLSLLKVSIYKRVKTYLLENSSRSWKELSVVLNVIVRVFSSHCMFKDTDTNTHIHKFT